jgi:hypothetical protein
MASPSAAFFDSHIQAGMAARFWWAESQKSRGQAMPCQADKPIKSLKGRNSVNPPDSQWAH